jgi:hypothetical protein
MNLVCRESARPITSKRLSAGDRSSTGRHDIDRGQAYPLGQLRRRRTERAAAATRDHVSDFGTWLEKKYPAVMDTRLTWEQISGQSVARRCQSKVGSN